MLAEHIIEQYSAMHPIEPLSTDSRNYCPIKLFATKVNPIASVNFYYLKEFSSRSSTVIENLPEIGVKRCGFTH